MSKSVMLGSEWELAAGKKDVEKLLEVKKGKKVARLNAATAKKPQGAPKSPKKLQEEMAAGAGVR